MKGSLSTVVGFVSDAFAIPPGTPYEPENVQLGEYTFVPWVRTGLAAQLEPPVGGAIRATVTIGADLEDDTGARRPIEPKTLVLRGPGDVIGLDAGQIVRRHPTPGSQDVESTFLAHVELDRPELPWLFTPFRPEGDRLAPWLVLVVVEETASSILPGNPGLPLRLETRKGELQPLDDSWAFAHAQVVGSAASPPSVADRLSGAHAPVNLSRVLCPRALAPERRYRACLVPAFDCGRRAGLGLEGGTLEPAWTRAPGDADETVVLPVYDHWSFRTAPGGDFESLAERLHGVTAPWNVGRRLVDAARPRGGLAPLAADEQGRLQVLRCALVSPNPAPPGAPSDGSAWTAARREALRVRVDEQDAIAGSVARASDLPRVSPRAYARFQRAQSRVGRVDDGDWFPELNTTPMHRVVAGLGTRVVRKDQEALVQAAWAQVGEIDRANQRIARAQFARFAGAALHARHLSRLALGDLAQVTRGVHGKLRLGGSAVTIAGQATRSATAPAALTGAFRRATRTRGPLGRFLAGGAAAMRTLVAEGARFRDFRRPYVEPDGVAGLSDAAIQRLPAEAVGRALGVDPRGAADALRQRVRRLEASPTTADQLLAPPATWHVPATTIDLGRIGATRLLEAIEATLPTRIASDVARSEALGAALVGIAEAAAPEVSPRAGDVAKRIGVRLPAAVERPVVSPPVARPARLRSIASRAPAGAAGAGRVTGAAAAGVSAAALADARGPAAGLGPRGEAVVHEISTEGAAIPVAERLDTATARIIGAGVAGARAMPMRQAAGLLADVTGAIGTTGLAPTPDRPLLVIARNALLQALDPRSTVTAYVRARLEALPPWLPPDWFDDGQVQPVMAAPRFDVPMYEALDRYGRDWLVPGLGAIRESDFVTLLETNPVFTEAFLLGLSDEMARELLWREYPTDQRGTYFHRFWDAEEDELEAPIHAFTRTPLGTHLSAASGGAGGRIVLVVRGALVRRYPDAMLLAMREIGTDAGGRPIFADPPETGAGRILFHAALPPDVVLCGFDLGVDQVRSERWWFVIAEHPTEPRFGLDAPPAQPAPAAATLGRDDLTWDSFGALRFGRFLATNARTVTVREPAPSAESTLWSPAALHAGAVARVLLQNPFRAAFLGQKLVAAIQSVP